MKLRRNGPCWSLICPVDCWFAILVACVITCGGCSKSKSFVPIIGSIHVQGKPAAGAVLIFHPVEKVGGTPASGVADDDGSFTLVTGKDSGVEAGKYRVTVTWPDESKRVPVPPSAMGTMPEDPPDLLQGRYASLQNTTLEAEVELGTTELKPFNLDVPPK